MRTPIAPLVTWSLLLAGAAAFGGGCSSRARNAEGGASAAPAASAAPVVDEAARKEAQEIFATRCTVCHGPEGAGNGPASGTLDPKPRNFTDRAWQGSVTDEHIEKIVQYGGAAVGKSPAMPPNPDLMAKPTVVAGLRDKVRSLAH